MQDSHQKPSKSNDSNLMIKNEFIGKRIKVIDAKNPYDVGIEGIVIDETKNTFVIENGKRKKIIKQNIIIQVDGIVIDGKKLTKRPEERIKG